jgi:hypothetical protein
MAVQRNSTACSNDTTTVAVNPAVIRARSFLLLSSRRDSVDQGNSIPRLAELTTTTAAEIRKTGGCAGSDTNHLQVVDYTGAEVQRGLTDLTSGASKQVNLSPSVALDRSILLYSWLSDGSGAKICDRVLRGELTNGGGRVTFSRGDGDIANCTGSAFTAISYEVVQFPVGTVVQQLTRQLAAATLTADITLPSAVDRSRTLVLAGGQWASGQVHGEGRHFASELISEMRARATLIDNTTLRLTRETANASATFTVYVVQLKP